MDKNKIEGLFNSLESSLRELKSEFLSIGGTKVTTSGKKQLTANKKKKGIGPAKPISDLLSNGYFDSSKGVVDLSKEFKKRAQNFSKDVISMALMRLVRKGVLQREGEGTSKSPWKYKKV